MSELPYFHVLEMAELNEWTATESDKKLLNIICGKSLSCTIDNSSFVSKSIWEELCSPVDVEILLVDTATSTLAIFSPNTIDSEKLKRQKSLTCMEFTQLAAAEA
jgi:hypothetical protein